jgi:limonene-1,2-epoxide hydrolase
MTKSTKAQIVQNFLDALAQQDIATAAALLDPNLKYTNVSLPTITGGEKVIKLFTTLGKAGMGFEVKTHHIATQGTTVMTQRTDILSYKNFKVSFWVCGTFEVQDGLITVWRDHFDWFDMSKGAVIGLLGIVLPAYRATLK